MMTGAFEQAHLSQNDFSVKGAMTLMSRQELMSKCSHCVFWVIKKVIWNSSVTETMTTVTRSVTMTRRKELVKSSGATVLIAVQEKMKPVRKL